MVMANNPIRRLQSSSTVDTASSPTHHSKTSTAPHIKTRATALTTATAVGMVDQATVAQATINTGAAMPVNRCTGDDIRV